MVLLVENEKVLNEIPKAVAEGVTGVKTFLANKGEKFLGRAGTLHQGETFQADVREIRERSSTLRSLAFEEYPAARDSRTAT